MTFKHVKFEDSSVMRSLERVAQEKGLVKPEPLTKAAMTKKADLTPSTSLTENVIKLCAGLRERGFDKYAEELEFNLLNYKKAQTLYETSPEKGEDVINFAHPKGSHKLEDVDSSEAVFEDILDKHTKILDVVNKKPTGKLSTASAIKAVKKVLGEATDDANLVAGKKIYDGLIEEATKLVTSIIRNENLSDWSYHQNDPILRSLQDNPEAGTGFALKTTKGHFQVLLQNLNDLMREEPSVDSVNEFKNNLNSLFTLINKASNIAAETKLAYTKQTRDIYSRTDSVLKALRGQPQTSVPNATNSPANDDLITQTVQQITSSLSRLNAFKLIVNSNPQFTSNPQAKGQALKFINDATQKMSQYKDTVGQIPKDQAASLLPAIKKYVDPLMADINQFGTSWLGVGA
jgi:hypothetical protein